MMTAEQVFWQSPAAYWPAYVLISCIIWLIIYRFDAINSRIFGDTFKQLARNQQLEWHSRVCSTVHAILAFLIGAYCLVKPELWQSSINATSWVMTLGLSVTCGYMLVDALYMFRYLRGWEMLQYQLHHWVGFVGTVAFLAQPAVHSFLSVRYVTELSTPFVNQLWFFKTTRTADKYPNLNLLNSLVLLVTFVSTRIAPLPIYWYLVVRDNIATDFIIFRERLPAGVSYIVLAFLIDFLNIFWTKKLFLGAKKLMQKYFARNAPLDGEVKSK